MKANVTETTRTYHADCGAQGCEWYDSDSSSKIVKKAALMHWSETGHTGFDIDAEVETVKVDLPVGDEIDG